MHPKQLTKGFTLMELVVVVAIVGILASVAYPSYMSSVRKANRDDAKAALMQLAGALERRYSTQIPRNYAGAAQGASLPSHPLPAVFSSTSPIDGGEAVYNLFIDAADQNGFTIRAEGIGNTLFDRNCRSMTYSSTGQKTPLECWR